LAVYLQFIGRHWGQFQHSNIHVIVEDMARPLRLEFSGAQYHVTL